MKQTIPSPFEVQHVIQGNGSEPKFRDVLLAAMGKNKVSQTEMAKIIGVTRQRFAILLKEDLWPQEGFRDMCKRVGLRDDEGFPLGKARAQLMYPSMSFMDESRRRSGKTCAPGSMQEAFNHYDKAMRPGYNAFQKASNEHGSSVFDSMELGSCLFVLTSTLCPMIYRIGNDKGIAQHAIEAIKRGTRMCVFVPSYTLIETYIKRFHFDDLHEYPKFESDFIKFREQFVASRALDPSRAEKYFHDHVLQIEAAEDCPFFTPSWIFSLFVHVNRDQASFYRTAIRAPDMIYGPWNPLPALPLQERRFYSCTKVLLEEEKARVAKALAHASLGDVSAVKDRLHTINVMSALLRSDHEELDGLNFYESL